VTVLPVGTGRISERKCSLGRQTVSDSVTMTTEEKLHMVATSERLTQGCCRLGTTARGVALALLAAALITGCGTSTPPSSATPQSGFGTIVGIMQGEGGARPLGSNGNPTNANPTWRICGSLTATELGGRSRTLTVPTDATGQFTLKIPAGSYRLTSSNTSACSNGGRVYSAPACSPSPCHEATPAPVVVRVTAGHESRVTLNELVP